MNEEFEEGERSNRWWMLTYNNPPEDWEAAIQKIGPSFWAGQLEQGKNGTFHIQAILWFKDRIGKKFWKSIPVWSRSIKARDVPRVLKYCTKEDTRKAGPVQHGKSPIPSTRGDQGGNGRLDYSQALALTREGRIQDVEATIQIRHYPNLLRIYEDYLAPYTHHECRGIWIQGRPGWGKSKLVRDVYSEVYVKAQNKWWDGYCGEETVVLDDLDHSGSCLGHYLKIWLDQYACSGERKGGNKNLRHHRLVITSNYLPSDLWQDEVLVEAITRRCRFALFPRKYLALCGTDFGVMPRIYRHTFEKYINSFISY